MSEDYRLEGTEELRAACLQWQGEGPDPWMELRRVQLEFLEGKLKALIQKVESQCAQDPLILLPSCGTEEPDLWMKLRRVQLKFLEGKLKALSEKLSCPRRHVGRVLVPVREAAPAHRLDSTKPDITGPIAQCQEAPDPDLTTTTSHPEPSSQGDTALSPTTNTQRRSLKRIVTHFRTSIVSRFRSPRFNHSCFTYIDIEIDVGYT
ncbi:uncharacterized protein LOC103039994 [Astyanax mexicanus]|uniref:uncharacterized protein LOC103039994 n=1 Tax=Astyanax mexicanus TaxID=7994 RepID=UPI000BBD786B|nr:uncharacterized protein LOC103039994 [Astyanax mexicanus]